ncbi:TIGR03089 family protein [Isoptericola jiangsuensis]|uniref:TIGR03089 family protein n=1 Tax=Isoptericola jiangsuensis TaxID=548579 RepID=UPI003AAD9423
MSTAPSTVTALLDHVAAGGGRPALTWYGDDGERIELSGAVVLNWVSKTVNLLVEEFDAGPGTDVVVDLPVGWRQTVWALAAARCGAQVHLADPGSGTVTEQPGAEEADVVVTSRPADWSGTTADLVAVALPALARRFDGELPAGAVDAAAAVMTYGDVIGYDPAAGSPAPLTALTARPRTASEPASDEVSHEVSVEVSHEVSDDARDGRVLVRGDRPVSAVLATTVGVWAHGGSVVLTSAATAHALDADAARLDRLVATEQITAGHRR